MGHAPVRVRFTLEYRLFSSDIRDCTLGVSSKRGAWAPCYVGTYDPERGFYFDRYTAMLFESAPRRVRLTKQCLHLRGQ